METWMDLLRDGAEDLGLTINEGEVAQFERFFALLLERNRVVNLTAITDPAEFAIKHFLDSLTVETIWRPLPGESAIDIGTGAGFPGMPLAIRYPGTHFFLADSIGKKVDFLLDAVAALGLTNVTPLWARAETLGRDADFRGRLDTAFVRAVAHLGALVEYALPLLRVGGRLIAMKGPSGEEEITASGQALAAIGGEVTGVSRLTLPGGGERLLIIVKKIRPTPDAFPRDPGLARKKPLYLDSSRRTA